jgi:hypothetical protein
MTKCCTVVLLQPVTPSGLWLNPAPGYVGPNRKCRVGRQNVGDIGDPDRE